MARHLLHRDFHFRHTPDADQRALNRALWIAAALALLFALAMILANRPATESLLPSSAPAAMSGAAAPGDTPAGDRAR